MYLTQHTHTRTHAHTNNQTQVERSSFCGQGPSIHLNTNTHTQPHTNNITQVGPCRRDPQYADNNLLPTALYATAGQMIYAGLLRNFTGPNFYTQPPQPCADGNMKCVAEGFKQLYTVIGENGYALGRFKAIQSVRVCECVCEGERHIAVAKVMGT
jgi:hypothetical protein